MLLRLADDNPDIGPAIPELRALVSVTASAGQVAREMARILRIPHWEAPSVYDLNEAEWPDNFGGEPVLVIDDLIDTGTASAMLIDELKRRRAECVGVLSVLASREGHATRQQSLSVPILSIIEVELGRPTRKQIAHADDNDLILDIDPHTLEPMPRKRFIKLSGKNRELAKEDLTLLARYGGLRSGHFVYGGHHYYEFFDIVQFMEDRDGFHELWKWITDSLRQWHSDTVAPIGGEKAPVVIVYPYYSPVAAFLHRIEPLVTESVSFPCTIRVARPYQRSKRRLGYRLDSLTRRDRFAVFIDDGIASGGTLSEIVDEFVALHSAAEPEPEYIAKQNRDATSRAKAAMLALPVFDRIGMNPRKHLRNVQWYHGGVRFQFGPRYSLNLRAYYAKDCPLCRIESDVRSILRTHDHLKQQVGSDLTRIRELMGPTYLTPVATCAPTTEMSLLSRDDTAAVVNASDALFSDLASGSEIKRSIRDDPYKSRMASLEILLNVMMDPILCRSVQDKRFFTDTITDQLWHSDVSSDYRSYFLMHVPYFNSEELARDILLDVIPQSLRAVAEPIQVPTESGIICETLSRYFDSHREVFAAIIMAIWILRQRCPSQFQKEWDAQWRDTLRGTPYGNQFVCGLSLTKKEVAREYAVMLLCNFVASYSGHRESFFMRLEEMRNLINAGSRGNAFPRHLMQYLTNAVETVREHYDLEDSGKGLLSREITDDVLRLHNAWLDGDDNAGANLKALLVKHFVPEQTIHESTLTRQLRDGLIPETGRVVELAMAQYRKWLEEQYRIAATSRKLNGQTEVEQLAVSSLIQKISVNNEAMGVRVFGGTHFVVRALAHLLRNPFESGMGRGVSLLAVEPKISLSVTKITENGREYVRFEVSSVNDLTQEQVDRCFRAGGGLMAQKQVIERWGGEMNGYPIPSGRVAFFIKLETFDIARRRNV